MNCRLLFRIIVLLTVSSTSASADDEKKNAYTTYLAGEVYFQSYLGHHFDALSKLDILLDDINASDEDIVLNLKSFDQQQRILDVSELEINYGLSQLSGRAVRASLDNNKTVLERNLAAYRLADIYFRQNTIPLARHALELIRGDVPDDYEDDVRYLEARILYAEQQYTQAIEAFEEVDPDGAHGVFARFNQAAALTAAGHEEQSWQVLDDLGQSATDSVVKLALRDKANIILARDRMAEGEHAASLHYFNRVSLDGPFTNKALLGAGWAQVALNEPEKAQATWRVLIARDKADRYVQEALLALPYVISQSGDYLTAVELYEQAIATYRQQLEIISGLQQAMQGDELMDALIALFQSSADRVHRKKIINTRTINTGTRQYLYEMLASDRFIKTLQDYIDMSELQRYFNKSLVTLGALSDFTQAASSKNRPVRATDRIIAGSRKLLGELSALGEVSSVAYKQAEEELRETIRVATGINDSNKRSYRDFHVPLRQAYEDVNHLQQEIAVLMGNQLAELEQQIGTVLEDRKRRLQRYKNKAELYRATSYDSITGLVLGEDETVAMVVDGS